MGRSLPILGVPGVLGEHKRTLIITDFTQSLGAELLTNPDFSAWTDDNPDGWTVLYESGGNPEATERDPDQTHADAKTVGGALNLYNTTGANVPRVQQTVLTVGHWYEVDQFVTAWAVGYLQVFISPWYRQYNEARHARDIMRSDTTAAVILISGLLGDATIDSISAKRITLNAQQTMPADAIIDFTYALPVSPVAGDTINVFYRISGASLEAAYTCWRAYIRRNDANTNWDFRLDSVSAGTATNRINATYVGDVIGIRVQCAGSLHDFWTTVNGTDWTKRGAQINVSHNDTQTGVNTVYSSQATPTKLTVTPL
ncbi:MAG: hypothetical protein WC683_14525 [bacterium]